MGYIFLSHSSCDNATADLLHSWLQDEGHQTLFVDHDSLTGIAGGQLWEERLYTELQRCRALVALVTPEWLSSPWCIAEANHAQALRKAVIPLLAKPVNSSLYEAQAPPVLRRVQTIKWRSGNDADAKNRLHQALVVAGLDPKDLFSWTGNRSPYPGLAAFNRADAAVYFGREQEITNFLAAMRACRAPDRPRLVLLQGASGTGKSSLLRAGILPRLERNPDSWIVVPPFRPLRDPFVGLIDSLGAATEGNLPEAPRASGDIEVVDHTAWTAWIIRTAASLRQRLGRPEATVLISVDQLEEVFLGRAAVGDAFLLGLRGALDTSDHRLLALATLRADFAGYLQRHSALREAPYRGGEILNTQSFQLGPLRRASFYEVIERPAAIAGLELETGLSATLVDDSTTEDALPLLAFTLHELWDRFGERELRLTHRDYESFGGLEKAVGRRAKEIFAQINPSAEELESFRKMLVFRMAELSTNGRIIRRAVPWDEIPQPARRLTEEFIRARLFVADDKAVEVAHEALFRHWQQLRDWIDATEPGLKLLQKVRLAAAEWEQQGRRDEFLWPDKRLVQVWDIFDQLAPELNETEQRFVRPFDRNGMLNELSDPVTSHERRAAIGDYLAKGADPRPGVGVTKDGLPDLVWCDVPGGEIKLEGQARAFRVEHFEISKYPVTWAQYRTFLEAPDGYHNSEWWKLLSRENNQPGDQYRRMDNHPAENVSWYDAVAFCRWLSTRFSYHVRLPTEWEWQQAALGGREDRKFPWGNEWNSNCANTAESGLNRTIAVGLYELGGSPSGVLDLSGNVWEWCLNEYISPECLEVTGDRPRVVRGGSFFYDRKSARTKYRDRDLPSWRNLGHGFRLGRYVRETWRV
jgi:formylglycine-generating enzyme required for sulfatase activity